MSGDSPCAERRLVDRHFGGRISPADEERLREHLHHCKDCYAYYERHQLLETLDPGSLPDEERIARGLGFSRRRSRSHLVAVAVAAAAACLLLVVLQRGGPAEDAFQRRGGGGAVARTTLRIYKIARGAPPARVRGSIAAEDELAFAYVNGAGKHRLLVFAVDDRDEIYWYHPAWTDPAANPTAIPILPGAKLRELPDAVAHRYKGSTLTIHGVFTDRDLSVRDVEQIVRRHRGAAPLRITADAVQVTHAVRIKK